MTKTHQKLELTWIGKGDEPKLEPRILIENPDYSYGDPNSENMMIHGDNLLALKALEQDYSESIKFTYIDPPFNTGAAFDNYDDGIEHSIWLDLMFQRLAILKTLLRKDGSIMVHLDDNESDYCKIILDQIFGRSNFINRITVDARSPSAFSTVNPGVFKASEYILWYAKDKSLWESRSMRIPSERDIAYNKFIVNREKNEAEWQFKPLKLAFLEYLNSDRILAVNSLVINLFERAKGYSKNDLVSYLRNSFTYHSLFDLKQVANYIFTKLKSASLSEFSEVVYPYLIEKCSVKYDVKEVDEFVFNNASSVCRETEISDDGAGKETVNLKYLSIEKPNTIFKLDRDNGLESVYIFNGKQISFYNKNVAELEGRLTATKLLTNIWTDISWEGIANEGGVKFKKGKKPEKLIKRCIELNTNPGDFVLDSFLGSGTTASVAQKMKRKWIGIEFGEQAITHCFPRISRVINGEKGGISKLVDWQGGGGFKFYTLAPSLLNKDKFGNWVITKEYNPAMLAASMAKQEGFKYLPSEHIYWKQGYSSEKDFIYTTTQFITVELLNKVWDEMLPNESLLVTCKAYQKECIGRFANISIKKIPQMLLGKCEYGRDDYSLNIVNLLKDEVNNDDYNISENLSSVSAKGVKTKKNNTKNSNDLFD